MIIPVQLVLRMAMLAKSQFNPYRAAGDSDSATQESETKALSSPVVDEGVVVTGATREEDAVDMA